MIQNKQGRDYIVITGALGFIGTQLARWFNSLGNNNLILFDTLGGHADKWKWKNLSGVNFLNFQPIEMFQAVLKRYSSSRLFVFHLGANSSTVGENFADYHLLNSQSTTEIFYYCADRSIPLVYASTASTYGNGREGFSDAHENLAKLRPLTPYAMSKHIIDLFAINAVKKPDYWWGLKFFNVFGAWEWHKRTMASMIFQAATYFKFGRVNHLDGLDNPFPMFVNSKKIHRDFIPVHEIFSQFINPLFTDCESVPSGIYNIGTGKSESFYDVIAAVARHYRKTPQDSIKCDVTPDLKLLSNYQMLTIADLCKWEAAGVKPNFQTYGQSIKRVCGEINLFYRQYGFCPL